MGCVVEAFRHVAFTDSQSLDSAYHQRVVRHISLVAQSYCLSLLGSQSTSHHHPVDWNLSLVARARGVRGEPSACLARFTRLSVLLFPWHFFLLSLSFSFLFFSPPLHGHVDDVQREVARKCGLAHFLLFQALLYSRAACSVKSPKPRFQVLYSSSYSSLLSSQGGGTSSFLGELSHLTASSGIRSRCDPWVSRNAFLSLPSSHLDPPAHISSCGRCHLYIFLHSPASSRALQSTPGMLKF